MAVARIFANYQGNLGWGPAFEINKYDYWPPHLKQLLANGKFMLYGRPEQLLVWLSEHSDKQLVAGDSGNKANVYCKMRSNAAEEYFGEVANAIKGPAKVAKSIAIDTAVWTGKAAVKKIKGGGGGGGYKPGKVSKLKRAIQRVQREKIGYLFCQGEARYRYLNFTVDAPIALDMLAEEISRNTP